MSVPVWDNVLILQTSFLGDTVLTLPLLCELRRRFPVRRLTLLCLPAAGELLRGHPAIDELLIYDKRGLDRGWRGLWRVVRQLKARRFTIALTPHKSLRSAAVLALAGIPFRVGFRESRGWFLFHRRPRRNGALHDVERNLSVLQPFGPLPPDCERKISLPVSAAALGRVREKLAGLGLRDGTPVIGLSPGSVWPTKRWSVGGFAALARSLSERHGFQVLLFGGIDDAAVVEAVQRGAGTATINLVGRIGLGDLAAAISQCDVFVTNDSGPMHIAVAREVPTVAIFCATTPELGFYPYSGDAIVVQRQLACRPCASHGGRRCPLGTAACSEEINPETVLEAVERQLRGGRKHKAAAYAPELLTV
jgi:heptosyltransferase-2